MKTAELAELKIIGDTVIAYHGSMLARGGSLWFRDNPNIQAALPPVFNGDNVIVIKEETLNDTLEKNRALGATLMLQHMNGEKETLFPLPEPLVPVECEWVEARERWNIYFPNKMMVSHACSVKNKHRSLRRLLKQMKARKA